MASGLSEDGGLSKTPPCESSEGGAGREAGRSLTIGIWNLQPEAWELANNVLLAQDLPTEPRVLAAMTFHTKVRSSRSSLAFASHAHERVHDLQAVYDLEQLPHEARTQLRDTLLVALQGYAQGPRVIQARICLALAAMALQMQGWTDVVPGMIAKFGNDPGTVNILLEFLAVLPEEMTMNHRIPIDVSETGRAGARCARSKM